MSRTDRDSATHPRPGWRSLFASDYLLATTVISLSVVLHAADSLIVSTVMPSAVRDIGGAGYVSWTLTVYVVASVMGSLAGGQARAMMGARLAYQAGTALFALGTLLCTMAPEMVVFIAGRGIQGLGGGLLAALSYGLIRRLYPKDLWATMFALGSAMWGLAALAGPLIGGVFAEFDVWRWSFGSVVLLSGVLAGMAWIALPAEAPRRDDRQRYPFGRLVVMGASALAVSVAGSAMSVPMAAGLLSISAALAVGAVRADGRASNRLLPRDALRTGTSVGAGIWLIFTLCTATYSFTLYGPYLLQHLHGLSPLQSGYMAAWEALSWTLMAMAVARWPTHRDRPLILAGPPLVGLGLAGIAWLLPAGPLAWLPVAIFPAGAGMGVCWAFVCARVLAGSAAGEEDVAGSAISTVQMMGIAYGAAFAGLIANAAGFSDALTMEVGQTVAFRVHAAFILAALVAAFFSVRLARSKTY